MKPLAALLILASTVIAAPPKLITRCYTSEVAPMVAAWKANPPADANWWRGNGSHTIMVLANEVGGAQRMRDCCEQLKAITPDAIPGLRIGPLAEPGFPLYMDAAYWQKHADNLTEISKVFHDRATLRVHFETENFVRSGSEAIESAIAPLGGREKLRQVMKPLLDVLSNGRQWEPLICPANENDVVIQLILERVRKATLMDENAFNLEIAYRRSQDGFRSQLLKVHLSREAILDSAEKYCSNVEWVPGLTEESLRTSGARWRRDGFPLLGVRTMWMYNDDKNAARNGLIPSQQWQNWRNLSSLNDCQWWPFTQPAGLQSWNLGDAFTEAWIDATGSEEGAYRAPPRTYQAMPGYWGENRRFLQHPTLCHIKQSFALAVDIIGTPTEPQAIGGVWYLKPGDGGYKEWLLRIGGGRVWLDYRDDVFRSLDCGPLSSRVILSWDVDAKTWSVVNGDTVTAAKSAAQASSHVPFYLGIGSNIKDGMKALYSQQITFGQVHAWGRALTAAEMQAAKSDKYPFGS